MAMANGGSIKSSFKTTRSYKSGNQEDEQSKKIATLATLPRPMASPIGPQGTIKVTRKRALAGSSPAKPLEAPVGQPPAAKRPAVSVLTWPTPSNVATMPPPPPPLDMKTLGQIIALLRGRISSSTSAMASRTTHCKECPSKDAAPSKQQTLAASFPGDLGPMPLRPSLTHAHGELVMLMDRVSREEGMTASLLLLGERGVGKTLVVESALRNLLSPGGDRPGGGGEGKGELEDKAMGVVRLSGLVHLDERIAFQEVARQLCEEFQQVFSRTASYDENLVFLRTMLQALHRCLKSVVFIIDEIDAFTRKGKQTLLYNLLDTLSHSKVQALVIGVSSVVDVMDSMEKRVRSRFSHRRIVLQPPQYFEAGAHVVDAQPSTSTAPPSSTKASDKGPLSEREEEETPLAILRSILMLPSSSTLIPAGAIHSHNSSVSRSLGDPAVTMALSQSFNVKLRPSDLTGIAQRILQEWAIDLVPAMTLYSNSNPTPRGPPPVQPLSPGHALRAIQGHQQIYSSQVSALVDCSVLQTFLVVAMHRISTTKKQDTCNFEMAYDEMRSFIMAHAAGFLGGVDPYRWGKEVALRAFQGLVGNGLVVYVSLTGERHAGRGSAFMGAELRAGRGVIEGALRERGDEGCPDLLMRFFKDS